MALTDTDHSKSDDETGIVLTPQQLRSRRNRNIAIGLAIGFCAILFYVVSIAKFAVTVMHKGG